MPKCLTAFFFVLLGVACGGTTDSGEETGGGSSQGGASGGHAGNGTAGKAKGGSVGTSGSVGTGGSSSGDGGAISFGGSVIIAGNGNLGGFGGSTVNPNCPPRRPMGACTDEDAGAACQYDQFTGCLCYAPSAFAYCQKVDPTCTAAGTAGAPAAAPPPADPGVGGFSTNIALPPQQVCRCAAGMWTCTFGF
jgi:hypothetical protein